MRRRASCKQSPFPLRAQELPRALRPRRLLTAPPARGAGTARRETVGQRDMQLSTALRSAALRSRGGGGGGEREDTGAVPSVPGAPPRPGVAPRGPRARPRRRLPHARTDRKRTPPAPPSAPTCPCAQLGSHGAAAAQHPDAQPAQQAEGAQHRRVEDAQRAHPVEQAGGRQRGGSQHAACGGGRDGTEPSRPPPARSRRRSRPRRAAIGRRGAQSRGNLATRPAPPSLGSRGRKGGGRERAATRPRTTCGLRPTWSAPLPYRHWPREMAVTRRARSGWPSGPKAPRDWRVEEPLLPPLLTSYEPIHKNAVAPPRARARPQALPAPSFRPRVASAPGGGGASPALPARTVSPPDRPRTASVARPQRPSLGQGSLFEAGRDAVPALRCPERGRGAVRALPRAARGGVGQRWVAKRKGNETQRNRTETKVGSFHRFIQEKKALLFFNISHRYTVILPLTTT